VERFNNEGIPRHTLVLALRDRRLVMTARRVDACLLCRRPRVNDSGLCDVCYSGLEGEELRLAVSWLSGVGP
jgi:hypothetical protein